MKQRLHIGSVILGTVIGAFVTTLVSQSIQHSQVAPWQIAPLPSEVYKKRLRQQIHQAARERWTLTRQIPNSQPESREREEG